MSAPASALALTWYGHACWGLRIRRDLHLVIDPWRPDALGGRVRLPPLPATFTHAVSTHDHADHDGVASLPGVTVLGGDARIGPLTLRSRPAPHDEHGGRLRGGLVRILDLRVDGLRIVHASDLGERPDGDLLRDLRTPRIDVLILPCGGHFTLGGDGAAELIHRANPRIALPCHAREDGVALDELASVDDLLRRFPDAKVLPHATLTLDGTLPDKGELSQVIRLTRPTSGPIHGQGAPTSP